MLENLLGTILGTSGASNPPPQAGEKESNGLLTLIILGILILGGLKLLEKMKTPPVLETQENYMV